MAILDNDLAVPVQYWDAFQSILDLNTPSSGLETLTGLNVAALTSVTRDGEVDKEAFIGYYSWLIREAGVRGLLISGATGEGESVDEWHYDALLECANVLKRRHHIKIIAGVLAEDGEAMKAKADFLENLSRKHGFDYMLFTPPLGRNMTDATFSPADMVSLFGEISEITSKNLVIYRTKLSNINLNLDTLLNIHRATGGRLKAVKDTVPLNESLVMDYSASVAAQDSFELIQGNDNHFYHVFDWLFSIGRDYVGNTSGACNIITMAQIRQIMVASMRRAYELGTGTSEGSTYMQLAQDAQAYTSGFMGQNLRENMHLIGPDELKGRREPVLLKGFAWITSGKSFPLNYIDRRLYPFEDSLEIPYTAALVHSAKKRDQFLGRYIALN